MSPLQLKFVNGIPSRIKDYSQGALITELFGTKAIEMPMGRPSLLDLEANFSDIDCPLFELVRLRKNEDLGELSSFIQMRFMNVIT